MRKSIKFSSLLSRFIAAFPLIMIVLLGFLTLQTGKSYAQSGCQFGISKRATPSDGTLFTFDVTGATNTTGFDLAGGGDAGLLITGGTTAVIVEEVPSGWALI